MKLIISIFFILIFYSLCGQEVQVRTPDDNIILTNDTFQQNQEYIKILFLSDLDSSKFNIDSIKMQQQQLSLSPSKEFIAITSIDSINVDSSNVVFYNKYKKLIKTCHLKNIPQRIKISNDLRFINEGAFDSYPDRTTQIYFYNSDCSLNKKTPSIKFGHIHETLFTNTNYLYHLTTLDTMYCSGDCDIILSIYDQKFNLIGQHSFDKGRTFLVYSLKEEMNNLISVIRRENGIEKKYFINVDGLIVK